MYKIKDYSKNQAKKLGVNIKSSDEKTKYKIDVFDKNNNYITSIGDIKYLNQDYPSYIESHGLEYANKRRKLYHLRHQKEGIRGFFSKNILW
jgi:hypothetical protein